ncbi:MAG: hypothetical protein ISR90_04120 [Candidatus Marinimicrobia bacterium]|nr:hypothetical protein [Candidatus Neomarinimicrobiota bacterium]MBL7023223.1 hypothetical protein [Candidatus Neomarinimicrobiota bacterium]
MKKNYNKLFIFAFMLFGVFVFAEEVVSNQITIFGSTNLHGETEPCG